MKLSESYDGMYPKKGFQYTAENRGSPEVLAHRKEWLKEQSRQQDPYYVIAGYRRAAHEKIAALKAKHDRPELRKALGLPPDSKEVVLDERDPKDRHVLRRLNDLRAVLSRCNATEQALKKKQWKTATVNAVQLGIAGHIAFIARLLEPEVITGRQVRGGGSQGHVRTYGTTEELNEKHAE